MLSGSTRVDDEAVLHYCCHRCVGDGVLPLLLLLLMVPRAACMKWVSTVIIRLLESGCREG